MRKGNSNTLEGDTPYALLQQRYPRNQKKDGQDSYKRLPYEEDQVKTGWYTEAIEEGWMDRIPS